MFCALILFLHLTAANSFLKMKFMNLRLWSYVRHFIHAARLNINILTSYLHYNLSTLFCFFKSTKMVIYHLGSTGRGFRIILQWMASSCMNLEIPVTSIYTTLHHTTKLFLNWLLQSVENEFFKFYFIISFLLSDLNATSTLWDYRLILTKKHTFACGIKIS